MIKMPGVTIKEKMLPVKPPETAEQFCQAVQEICDQNLGKRLDRNTAAHIQHRLENLTLACLQSGRFKGNKRPTVVLRGSWVTDNEDQARNRAISDADWRERVEGLGYSVYNNRDRMRYELRPYEDFVNSVFEYTLDTFTAPRSDKLDVFLTYDGMQVRDLNEIWQGV